MTSATEVGGDVVAAGAAIAGLMLVYMGALSTGYASYDTEQQSAVRGKYRRRIWFAFVGLALNALAIPFGLAAKGLDCLCLLWVSLALLTVGIGWLIGVAYLTIKEIE